MNERDLEHWLGICTFLILTKGDQIMAAIDDLNANLQHIADALTALEARVAAIATANDPAIEAAAQTAQGFADRIGTIAP